METCLTVKNLQHHSWALMVQEQSNSGLSIRDWCSQNNISTKTVGGKMISHPHDVKKCLTFAIMPPSMQQYMRTCESADRGRILKVLSELTDTGQALTALFRRSMRRSGTGQMIRKA